MSRRENAQRVWVLSELYAPELTSTGYFITAIAEGLAAQTHRDVHVLASQPTYAARGQRAPALERTPRLTVRRFWSPAFPKDSVFGRLANMMVFTLSAMATLLKNLDAGDAVLVVTNPPLLPYLATTIARIRGAQVVLLVHDVYPEVLIASGTSTPDSWLVRTLHRTSRWLYQHCSTIVTLGRDMQSLIRAKTPDNPSKVVVIPNWASLDEVTPHPFPTDSSNPFTVQYAGNMGRGHNMEILFEAAKRLPHIQFSFVGEGAKRRWLEAQLALTNVPNVRVTGFRPRHELSASLGDCHVAAIAFMPGMGGISVPSRLYNIMASGRPVLGICDRDSELALTIQEENIGWTAEPDDVEEVVRALQHAFDSRQELPQYSTRARTAAETRYAFAQILEQFSDVFDRLAATTLHTSRS